jgi:outer membrane lipoprotein-sorting protein
MRTPAQKIKPILKNVLKKVFLPVHLPFVATTSLTHHFFNYVSSFTSLEMKTLYMSFMVAAACNMFHVEPIFAQPAATNLAVTDTKAKNILDKLRKQYDAYSTLQANFTLLLELDNGRSKDTQTGKITQSGNKYRIELKNKKGELSQLIISDGTTTWFMPNQHEVQITNASKKSSNGVVSPKEIVKMYDSGEYDYAITGEGTEGGKPCTYIEFKPKKKNSEYTKLRLAVSTRNNEMIYLKVFGRDQSRYTMTIQSLSTNGKLPTNTFTFDNAKYPKVKINDLRID